MAPKSVVIIDDEEMVVTMLEAWLISFGGVKVVGVATRGSDGVELCRKQKPDILLLDIEMPGMDGLEVARQVRRDVPSARIIILTSHINPYCIYEVSRLGVHGYVNKTGALSVLGAALQHVAKGDRYYSPLYHMIREQRLYGSDAFQKILTPKEVAILILMTEGIDDAVIGKRLNIAPVTVATHRRNVRLKIDAHNDRELIQYARRWGLIPLQGEHEG